MLPPLAAELINKFSLYQTRLKGALNKLLNQERQRLSYLTNRQVLKDPLRILAKYHQELDNLNLKLVRNYQEKIKDKKTNMELLINKLDALSPLKTLNRGYSISYNSAGKIIKSIDQVMIGDAIKVSVADGQLSCLVQEKKESDYEKANKL